MRLGVGNRAAIRLTGTRRPQSIPTIHGVFSKRLCWFSSVDGVFSPGCVVPYQGVEDGEQFSHAGGDGEFEGSSRFVATPLLD